MASYVIALSGAIGAGKSSLATQLVSNLGAFRVSFGDEVRRYAEANGFDSKDRSMLQQLGQALVVSELGPFVQRVLDQQPGWSLDETKPLVVEGLRHVEVLLELRKRVGETPVHLVFIDTPNATREQRLMNKYDIERRLVARYDADITEAQVARILPQYANLTIDGELPMPLQLARMNSAVQQWTGQRVREMA